MPNKLLSPVGGGGAGGGGQTVVRTDGAARGNPGPAGIGVVLEMPAGHVVQRIARAIGHRTNNQAEYEAVIAGLRAAQTLGAQQLTLILDSELVEYQRQLLCARSEEHTS